MSRTIVITGCSTGFGRLAALRLARAGDRVYATMRGIEGKNSDKAAALGSIVGSDFGIVRELNRLVEPLYDRLWADMGLTEVATIRPTD